MGNAIESDRCRMINCQPFAPRPGAPSPMQLALNSTTHLLRQFYELTKPRVVSLIVFCAVIGMFLAGPPDDVPPLPIVTVATLGIFLVAAAAAAVNCLIELRIDAVMARTLARPLPRGELTATQTVVFACAIGGAGL